MGDVRYTGIGDREERYFEMLHPEDEGRLRLVFVPWQPGRLVSLSHWEEPSNPRMILSAGRDYAYSVRDGQVPTAEMFGNMGHYRSAYAVNIALRFGGDDMLNSLETVRNGLMETLGLDKIAAPAKEGTAFSRDGDDGSEGDEGDGYDGDGGRENDGDDDADANADADADAPGGGSAGGKLPGGGRGDGGTRRAAAEHEAAMDFALEGEKALHGRQDVLYMSLRTVLTACLPCVLVEQPEHVPDEQWTGLVVARRAVTEEEKDAIAKMEPTAYIQCLAERARMDRWAPVVEEESDRSIGDDDGVFSDHSDTVSIIVPDASPEMLPGLLWSTAS